MTDRGVLAWSLFLTLVAAGIGGIVHDPSGYSWNAHYGALGGIIGLAFGVGSGLLFHERPSR